MPSTEKPEVEFQYGGRLFSKPEEVISAVIKTWSKSQPEEQFQYGERLFFQTEISYISAVN